MNGPADDWDYPEGGSDECEVYPGYRDAGAEWAPRRSRPEVPASVRIFAIADVKVREFCERPDVELDLPGAVAACLHIVRQTGFLAATAMAAAREADGLGRVTGQSADLREDFGDHIEDAMYSHADWLLDLWYRASRDKR